MGMISSIPSSSLVARPITTNGSDPGQNGISSIQINSYSNTSTTLGLAATLSLTTKGNPVFVGLSGAHEVNENSYVNVQGSSFFNLTYKMEFRANGTGILTHKGDLSVSSGVLNNYRDNPTHHVITNLLGAGTHSLTLYFAAASGGFSACSLNYVKFMAFEL